MKQQLYIRVNQLQVGLGGLDGDDIGVKGLDAGEDVTKVGVACEETRGK